MSANEIRRAAAAAPRPQLPELATVAGYDRDSRGVPGGYRLGEHATDQAAPPAMPNPGNGYPQAQLLRAAVPDFGPTPSGTGTEVAP